MRDSVHPAGEEEFYERNHMAGAVRAAGLVYISGMIGFRDGELPTDPEEQFTAAFDNVGAALAAAGLGFADVIDIHSFHVGLREHLATFVRVKDRYIDAPWPTWTAIGAAELARPQALVEIKVVAASR